MFSAKASALLREHHFNYVDWSKRDRELFILVAAGFKSMYVNYATCAIKLYSYRILFTTAEKQNVSSSGL